MPWSDTVLAECRMVSARDSHFSTSDPLSEVAVNRQGGPASVVFWIRLLIGCGIIGLLLWHIGANEVLSAVGLANPFWLLAAVGVQLIGKVIWSVRWSAILDAFDVKYPFGHLIQAIFVGQFFSNLMPTSFGGDFYRAYWVTRGEGSYTRSLFVVLAERAVGLIALGYVALPALLLLLFHSQSWGVPGLLWMIVFLVLLCAAVLIFRPEAIQALEWARHFVWPTRLQEPMGRFVSALGILQQARSCWMRITLASLGVQAIGIAFLYCLGHSLNLSLSGVHYFVLAPLTAIATMLPISINGLGVREGALILFAGLLGAPITSNHALALGLLSSALLLGVSLIGGIIYVGGKRPEGAHAT